MVYKNNGLLENLDPFDSLKYTQFDQPFDILRQHTAQRCR